ncbi:MAG: hypothetical protein ACOYM9_20185 [Bradymonadia bacterium]
MGFRLLSRAAAAALAFVACQPIEGEEADNGSPPDAASSGGTPAPVGGTSTPIGGTDTPPMGGEPTPPQGGSISPPTTPIGGAPGPPELRVCDPTESTEAFVFEAAPSQAGPFTRSDVIELAVTLTPSAPYTLSVDRGRVMGPSEGPRIMYVAGGGPEDPQGLPGPRFTGPARVTLTATVDSRCTVTTDLSIPMWGDVLIGDDNGGVFARGSDGRPLGRVFERPGQSVTALAPMPGGSGDVLVSFRASVGQLQGFERVRLSDGTTVTTFDPTHPNDDVLYELGAPRHFAFDPSTNEILADGASEFRVYRWDLDGQLRMPHAYVLPAPEGLEGASYGLAVVRDRVLASRVRSDQLYVLGSPVSVFLDTGIDFNELYLVGGGDADGFVTAQNGSRGRNRLVHWSAEGQMLGEGDLGDLEPETLLRFRDGWLSHSSFDPIRTHDPDLTLRPPGLPNERWDEPQAGAVARAFSVTWLDPLAIGDRSAR